MIKIVEKERYNDFSKYIYKINKSSGEIFDRSIIEEKILEVTEYNFNSNFGVSVEIKNDNYFVVYLYFDKDFDNSNILNHIEKILKNIIENKGDKDFYLNLYNQNKKVAEYLRKLGFKKDSSGIQYKIKLDKEIIEYIIPKNIYEKDFEFNFKKDYAKVLDEAFNDLAVSCGDEPDYYTKNIDNMAKWWNSLKDGERFKVFWVDNEIVALYYLEKDYINTIVVNPKIQRKGYGSVALKAALKKLYEKGYNEVFLNCLDENKMAHSFYKKHGFEEYGMFNENTFKG